MQYLNDRYQNLFQQTAFFCSLPFLSAMKKQLKNEIKGVIYLIMHLYVNNMFVLSENLRNPNENEC